MSHEFTRRRFIAAATATGVGLRFNRADGKTAEKPAILGGKPIRTQPFPSWPKMDALEDKALLEVLQSGDWFRGRGQKVERFEKAYARLTGAAHCVATANGTGALFTSLSALGIGPGDEVILPPYTFVATLNVILAQHALPIFVDTDRETFQIDAQKIESAITDRTAAIIPVHLGGGTADMDAILAVADQHKLPVVEDACQSHLAEWRGRKVGTIGTTGCFSFQNSKNLTSGEGGALLSNNHEIAAKCYAMHNNCRGRKGDGHSPYFAGRAINLRMTEFQGALLMAQMTRLEEQSRCREKNAAYLTRLLDEIPGITPVRTYPGCTRNAYHLYMFRYQPEQFAGLARADFLNALHAERIPASSGYTPLNKQPFIRETLQSRCFQKVYGKKQIAGWEDRNQCPENDRVCLEAAWFTQNMLLGPQSDMDQIAAAIRKIHAHADRLVRA